MKMSVNLFSVSVVLLIFLAYLAVISIISFIIVPIDKKKAKDGAWRIPEATLFTLSALGGSAAMYISMQIFRHKTKHKSFMIGIPLIFVAQVAITVLVVYLSSKGILF